MMLRHFDANLHLEDEAGDIMRAQLSAVLFVACSISVGARAWSGGIDACTNATLYGDYAFRIDGQLLPPGAPPVARQGVAMMHFDGAGGLTQVDFVMSNGAPLVGPADPTTGFHTQERGTYEVYPDCTGRAVIHFPAPPGATRGAEIDLMLVLGEHGRVIRTIVSRLLPPGSQVPMPASIHSDGVKFGIPAD